MASRNSDIVAVRHRLIQEHFLDIMRAHRKTPRRDRAMVVVLGDRDESLTWQILGHLVTSTSRTPFPVSRLTTVKQLRHSKSRHFIGLGAAEDLASAIAKVLTSSRTIEEVRTAPIGALSILCIAAGGLTALCPLEHPTGWARR
jgi:hypothetical protein